MTGIEIKMYLQNYFQEKDEIKKLGGKYNSEKKRWFYKEDAQYI